MENYAYLALNALKEEVKELKKVKKKEKYYVRVDFPFHKYGKYAYDSERECTQALYRFIQQGVPKSGITIILGKTIPINSMIL